MLRKFALPVIALAFLAATPAYAVDVTVGYTRGNGGFYKNTDASGPYSISSAGVATLLPGTGAATAYTGPAAAQLPASLGGKTSAGSLSVTTATDDPLIGTAGTASTKVQTVQGIAGGTPQPVSGTVSTTSFNRLGTYTLAGIGYAAYATPTDMLCIYGSNTKTVTIHAMSMTIRSTAAALQTIYYIKRSAVDTGGTATNPTPVANDSTAPAATATVSLYTAAPTLGTVVGNVRIIETASGLATTTPGAILMTTSGFSAPNSTNFQTPIILRGTGEGLCTNDAAAALTSGFVSGYAIEWTEY